MKIGVFDSGIGGKSIADSLQRNFPDAEIIRIDDRKNVPYGDKPLETIRELTDVAIEPLLTGLCDAIVIACNTATAASIEYLRKKYPQQKFVGLEPMVKPACEQTRTGTIAVCATPATLSSTRYRDLKQKYAQGVTLSEPDCSGWARMIEDNQVNETAVTEVINGVIADGADIIVLACTHYHWIRELIEKTVAGRATILDPSTAIARRVRSLLQT